MTGGALELGLGGSDEGPRVNGDTACLTQKGAAKVRSKCLQKHSAKRATFLGMFSSPLIL